MGLGAFVEIAPDDAVAVDVSGAIPYAAPVVSVFTHLQDLLLFDPIHEVTEAGWPTSPNEDARLNASLGTDRGHHRTRSATRPERAARINSS